MTKPKSRNSKPYRRGKTFSDNKTNCSKERTDKCDSKARDNDPSWYLVNGQLAKDVANFSFNQAVGDPITINHGFTSLTLADTQYRLPGVAAIATMPSIGFSADATSPVNVAMRNIYSFVRHANSGHANYDPADLMLYLLAVDSVQSYWSYLVRLYGLTQTFSQRNRYIGDALIRANGVDPASLRSNIARFRSYINQFAIKASVLAVPNTMSYYLRHAWMYQNVYMDEDDPKAQLFMYVPAFLYQYKIDEASSLGKLAPISVAATTASATQTILNTVPGLSELGLENTGDALINAMLTQEDVGIMSGDILKAYGSEHLYRFAQIDYDYSVVPVFSEEVLSQFHNTNFVGRIPCKSTDNGVVSDLTSLEITQDPSIGGGGLIFQPLFAGCGELAYTHLLDLWKSDVTPEDALVASRNFAWCTPVASTITVGSNTVSAIAGNILCGSEIFFDLFVWSYGATSGNLFPSTIKRGAETNNPDRYNENPTVYTKFNEFPLIRYYDSSTNTVSAYMGEVSNYATVEQDEIRAMHNAALLSMFGVPYQW